MRTGRNFARVVLPYVRKSHWMRLCEHNMEVLEKYNINWIMYNANSALSLFLLERDDWKMIYADKVANIFVKNTMENQHLIEKYPDVELVIEEDKSEDE